MKRFLLSLCVMAAAVIDGLRFPKLRTANTGESTTGIHADGITTKTADADFPNRYLFVKAGTDGDHVTFCDAASPAVGYTDDMPQAGDALNVQWPGAIKGSRKVIATSALAAEVDIYQAANGQVQGEPAAAGTYYKVGRTKAAAAANFDGLNIVEAVLHPPTKLIVYATGADFTAFKAALISTTGSLVKFLP